MTLFNVMSFLCLTCFPTFFICFTCCTHFLTLRNTPIHLILTFDCIFDAPFITRFNYFFFFLTIPTMVGSSFLVVATRCLRARRSFTSTISLSLICFALKSMPSDSSSATSSSSSGPYSVIAKPGNPFRPVRPTR